MSEHTGGPGDDAGGGSASDAGGRRDPPGLVGDPFAEIFERGPASRRPGDWPAHPAALADDELMTRCAFGRERGGGPGGQHRNKVETAVVLVHRATGVRATAGERRTVKENKPVALRRLRLALAVEHRVEVPVGEARTELWRSRTRPAKKGPGSDADARGRLVVSPRHRDFPSLLAEAMDMLAACGWEPKRAAVRLGVSATQLVRLVGEHPPAMGRLNAERKRRGLHALR